MPGGKTRIRFLTGSFLVSVFCGTICLQGDEPKDSPKTATYSKPKKMKATGIITAKSAKDIQFKREGSQEARIYLLTPPAEAVSPEMADSMKKVFVTNLVVVEWTGDEDPVVKSIQSIHSKTASGVTNGIIVAAEPTGNPCHFDVKPVGPGFTERYQPHYDVKTKRWELDTVIAKLKVGDKVKISWVYDERKHPKDIQVIGRAKEKSFPENKKK